MITIDLERRRVIDAMPGGVIGIVSFSLLFELLRAAGSIRDAESITHLRIDVERGLVEFRIDTPAVREDPS